jgi:hypothetical protein
MLDKESQSFYCESVSEVPETPTVQFSDVAPRLHPYHEGFGGASPPRRVDQPNSYQKL